MTRRRPARAPSLAHDSAQDCRSFRGRSRPSDQLLWSRNRSARASTATEQVTPDPADLVTNSVSSKACCLRNRTTEAARCLNRRDTVPIANIRQGQKLYGATRHVAMTRMLVWNLKTLHILFEYVDVLQGGYNRVGDTIESSTCRPWLLLWMWLGGCGCGRGCGCGCGRVVVAVAVAVVVAVVVAVTARDVVVGL